MTLLGVACLWGGAAAGADADQLEDEWRALMALQADKARARVVEAPIHLRDGPLELTLDRGVMVPVFSGRLAEDAAADAPPRGSRAFVGFVFTDAEARATVHWQERADDQAFANHMVRNLGHDRDALAPVAAGAPWTDAVAEGLVLSIDPAVQAMFLGPGDTSGDPLEVVVYDDRLRPGALARAEALFAQRVTLMADVGLHPGRWMATDRVARGRGLVDAEGSRRIIDVHTSTHLGRLDEGADDQPKRLDWLTLLRDDSGAFDPRVRAQVTTFDVGPDGRPVVLPLTGQPFPPVDPADPLSAPAAPVRMEARDAYVNIVVEPRAADMAVTFTARLRLAAVGGPIQWFELAIPRAGSRRRFALDGVTRLDGTPLLAEHPLLVHDAVLGIGQGPDDDGRDRDGDGVVDGSDVADGDPDAGRRGRGRRRDPPSPLARDPYHDRPTSTVTVALPEALAAGESVVLDVVWRDVWPWANVIETSTGQVNLGEGSGRRAFLPRLAGAPEGNPSKFRVRVAVPTRSRLQVAASGQLLGTQVDDLWTVVEAGNLAHRVPFADVAVGRFQVHDERAQRGLPAVRTRTLLARDGPELAAEVRRLVQFFQGYLPAYPWPEHEVFQGPSRVNGYVWVASHEMTQVMKAQALDISASASLARGGHVASRVFAHELAHQWWGHLVRPAHREDFWVAETFAEAFACIYLEAAFGACEDRMARARDAWQRPGDLHTPRASLTEAYRSAQQPAIVYQYGPHLFHRLLRTRLGHEVYHAALDVLVAEHRHEAVTTERLAAYLSQASGRSLDDFFDFWVYAGFVPEVLELTWHRDGDRVLGTVTVDVPFGTLEVPVRVGDTALWVEVKDGVGTFQVPVSGAAQPEVALDPDELVFARSRRVRAE